VHEVIAIIDPSFSKFKKENNQQESMSPLENALLQSVEIQQNMQTKYDFDDAFEKNYETRLQNALQSAISEIISAKGFPLKGPYNSFDDMTYTAKKIVYMACIPKVNFQIYNKVLKQEQHLLYRHTQGVIQIGGSVLLRMVEPLTGQVFLDKRIDLSDFNIQEPYVYDQQTSQGGGGVVSTIEDKATEPKHLVDTTDVALTKAINEFYAKTVAKLVLFIDRNEILSYKNDITRIKKLKRF
jgi:hypothetical protein